MKTVLRTKQAAPVDVSTMPVKPPLDWFVSVPEKADPTWPGVQLFEQGRVYARVADWDTCLLDAGSFDSAGECWTPPKSPTGYQLAHQGISIECDDGTELVAANIGGGVDHFNPMSMSATAAVDHYSNSASRMLRGLYHEDDQGVYFLGQLWPDLSDVDVLHARGTALSGDWRWRPPLGEYDMAGAQMVNNPGLPIGGARKQEFFAMAASLSRKPRPLVVRGGMGGAWISDADLEDPALAARVASLMTRTPDERYKNLAARVAASSQRLGIKACTCQH